MLIPRYLQLVVLGGALLGLAACGGSSSTTPIAGTPGNPFGNTNNNNVLCDPGTQVQLANPASGNVNVPTNVGQIIIVANGNNNTLSNSYTQWNVILTDNFGNSVLGGPLSLVPFTNGPHPYPTDYYYASTIPQLAAGTTFNVLLNENANCSPGPLGAFST